MDVGNQVRVSEFSRLTFNVLLVIKVVDLVWAGAAVPAGAAVLAAGVEGARTGGFAGGDGG